MQVAGEVPILIDAVMSSTAALTAGVDRMGRGSATATGALAGVPAAIDAMSSAVRQARSTMADVRGQLSAVGPRLHAPAVSVGRSGGVDAPPGRAPGAHSAGVHPVSRAPAPPADKSPRTAEQFREEYPGFGGGAGGKTQ